MGVLKIVANKIGINKFALFFHIENNNFLLYDQTCIFLIIKSQWLKNLKKYFYKYWIIQLNYNKPMILYICDICDIPRITDFLLLNGNIK